MSFWQDFLKAKPKDAAAPPGKLPAFAQLNLRLNPKEQVQLNLFTCCKAPEFFRAGFYPDEVSLLIDLPCDTERAELCRKKWDILEKTQIYTMQSAAAKAGDASMLKHLGRAVLEQDGKTRLIDPGIGDIIVNINDDEK